MTSKEKIAYTKNKILEKARISINPEKFFAVDISDLLDENNELICSTREQWDIIEILIQQGIIKKFFDYYDPVIKEAILSIVELDELTEDTRDYSLKFSSNGLFSINNEYKLAKPNFNGRNYNFIDFLVNKSTKDTYTKEEIECEANIKIDRTFSDILKDLKLTGELRKAFITISKNNISINKKISTEEFIDSNIDYEKFHQEIKDLKKLNRVK